MNRQTIAYASFDGNAGGPVVGKAIGCVLARTGAGVYTVTLGSPLAVDSTEALYTITANVATGGVWTMDDTSDTVKTFSVFTNAGVASDAFTARIAVERVVGGGPG